MQKIKFITDSINHIMKTTNNDFINAIANAERFVNENSKSKFTYALEKFVQKNKQLRSKYQESIEDLRIEHASVDDKGNLVINERGDYSFTKEQYKELTKKVREFNQKEIECEAYWVDESNIPKDLHSSYVKVFEGFVIFIQEEEE